MYKDVKRRREALGLTQKQVAELAGMKLIMYQRIEQGMRNPRLMTARKIADVLRVSLDIFLTDEKREER